MPDRNKLRRWILRTRPGDAQVNWGLAFGTPEVTVDFYVRDPQGSKSHPKDRPIQVRFDPEDARRVAVLMFGLGAVASRHARKAG